MALRLSRPRLVELWRYYQVGVVNTAFGVGLYSLLVWTGLNIYAAQLIAHFTGAAFNYLTYRRHVFRHAAPAKGRFALSYVVNYLVGLATLAVVSQFVASPYVAGILTTAIVSVINYFALKHLVFPDKAT